MTQTEIYKRCIREVDNSTTLPMLAIAKRYYDLFYLKLSRDLKFSRETLQQFNDAFVIKHRQRKSEIKNL
jgi:hypothetical protein